MGKILLYISPHIGVAQARLASECIREALDADANMDVQHGGVVTHQETQDVDTLIFLGDGAVSPSLETDFTIIKHRLEDAINTPLLVVEGRCPRITHKSPSPSGVIVDAATTNRNITMKKIVGITSCPTGIAHTFMAAEALEEAAKKLGYDVKIETQGSVGSQNTLTEEDIAQADCVVIAADTSVELDRFTGKKLYSTGTKAAINDGVAVIKTALSSADVHGASPSSGSDDLVEQTAAAKAEQKANLPGIYKNLMTGVSHMLPFVVAGGLLIALGFAIGSFQFGENGIHIYRDEYKDTLGATLFWIGKAAFALFVPILAAYIAYSIGGRAALAAGMVGGYMASQGGSGFLGAIIIGFAAGYLVHWLVKTIKLPKTLAGLVPILIVPLLSVMVIGLLMHYVIDEPVAAINAAMTGWLKSLTGANAVLLGLIVGAMMAFDMGGPVNKAAYVFATGLLSEDVTAPMAAVMAAGMTPPIAIFVASFLFKNKFLEEENDAAKAAGVLGISFITEGAIPFAARDPFRVIPALMLGSATAGALSMFFKCTLLAPHGGIFVLFIPNAVGELAYYVVAIAAGTLVSACALGLFKKTVR